MTISDANPVQFWAPTQDTFNEKEVDGIFNRCFCAPWNCSDTILVQILETTGQSLALLSINEDGEFLSETAFSEISTGVYQTSIVPSDEGICDEEIQLLIVNQSSIIRLLAPSSWSNGASAFDSKDATTFGENVSTADDQVSASMPLVVPAGTVVVINYSITVNGTWSAGPVGLFTSFLLKDVSNNTVSTGSLSVLEKSVTSNGTYTYSEILTATDTSSTLQLLLIEDLLSGNALYSLTITPGDVLYAPQTGINAKSDCLSIKEDHDETVLIEYSSNRNFAGLNYSNVTPDPSFFLRIPAVFFRQRFPQEKEVIELSNSRSIQLSAQVKAQKHLQVKNMPDYMHRKLLLALSHQFVTIDDQDWVLSEEYELIPPSNPRWPMQKAQCWLTEKDYIMRSIL